MTVRLSALLLLICLTGLWVGPARSAVIRAERASLYDASYALVIGNGRYSRGWQPLGGVAQDVDEVSAVLEASGFSVSVKHDLKSRELRETIEAFIAEHGNGPDDRVVIYYAGHGATLAAADGEQDGFLVPVDAPAQDAPAFRSLALSMNQLQDLTARMRAKHVLYLFDSCFSGSFLHAMRGGADRPASINADTQRPVRQVITSGTAEQRVPDESIFRRLLVKGLSGDADLNGDGYITGTELGFYLRSGVADASQGRQTPQFATLLRGGSGKDYSDFGDTVFLSPRGAAKPAADAALPVTLGRKPGLSFRDCDHCPVMTYLPPGNFQMGSDENDPESFADERPQRPVVIHDSLAFSLHSVTFDEWDECFREGGCGHWIDDRGRGRGRRPAARVSWDDAQDYVGWLSRKSGHHYRLPTETEWEYAARGGVARRRYWGDELGSGHANCRLCGSQWDGRETAPAGSFAPNPFGLFDMLGNVWQWVDDCQDGAGQTVCANRILRGGSFASDPVAIRSAARAFYPHNRGDDTIGFRVVRD